MEKITCPNCQATVDIDSSNFVSRDEYEEIVEELENLKLRLRNNVVGISDEEVDGLIQDGIERQNDIKCNR